MSLNSTQSLFEADYFTPNVAEAYTAPQPTALAKPLGNVIAFPAPQSGPRVLEDRWYQTNALAEIEARLPKGARRRGGKGEMLVSPTGCGKTSIASRAIKKWLDQGERVLILVDLERLLDQMFDDLADEGIHPLIEKAENSALSTFGRHGNCVLASMQTLHEKRLERWDRGSFDKIVIDEAHELKYLKILSWFNLTPYLGLTATPIRADKQSLKEWFHYPYIRTLTMREAIEGWDGVVHEDGHKDYQKPFLCRIRLETIPARQIDLSQIKILNKNFDHGRDFSAIEMDKVIYENTNFLASAIVTHADDRPSFTYCPKIQTAEAIAKAMRDIGASALAYTSNTPNPKEVMERFVRGEIQHLVNVNMLIKGVNVPKVSAIFRVRASLNVGQATQEIGRGTRNSPATGKKDCVIFEFDYNVGDKKLASVIDAILDGADDPDEMSTPEQQEFKEKARERAAEIVKAKAQEGDDDIITAFKKAQLQITFEMSEARRKRIEERQVKYQRVEVATVTAKYDPFAGLGKLGAQTSEAARSVPATPEQMADLERLSDGKIKASSIKHWTEAAAVKRMATLQWRRDNKMATEKQIAMMVDALGFSQKEAERMKKWTASAAINNRTIEMAQELEGRVSAPFEELKEMKPWELASLHKRLCGGVSA